MTAFFIAQVRIKDPEKFQAYAGSVGETFKPHGGELLLRGKAEGVLAGELNHDAVGIIRFPSQESLTAWHESDAYQALIPLRQEAAEMTITRYSVPT